MKTFLIILLTCFFSALNAQTVEYDYSSSSDSLSNPVLKNGNFARFKLINMNTYAQKVSINGSIYNLNTPIPAGIQKQFELTADQIAISLNSTNRALNQMSETAKESSNEAKNKDSLSMEVEAKKINDSLYVLCVQYYEAAKKVGEVLTLEKKLEETLANVKINSKEMMKKALLDKGFDKNLLKNLKKNKIIFEDIYNKVRVQYSKAEKHARKMNKEVREAKIEIAKEVVIEAYVNLDKIYDKTLNEIDILFDMANSDANFFAISNPVFLKDVDEIEFEIKIAKSEADLASANAITPVYKVDGGVKFDFSVGPVFNKQSDSTYFVTTDKKLLQNKNKNIVTPGLAAMMHITRRSNRNISIGGVFGVNSNFNTITDVDLGFLGGITTILGNDRKFFVSSGLSILKVNRLKEGYKSGSVYTDAQFANITEKVLQPSFFVSVSLSIAKRVKIK